jgi:uncharacterized protein (DUF1697 family)
MPVIIAMLRGVNIGGHHKIKMEFLRSLCESLQSENVQTYLQSGNAVFRARERNLKSLSQRMETSIEKKLGFRPDVILRTIPELREAIAHNPFAKRPGLEPSKLAVTFLAEEPGKQARENALKIKMHPEEVQIVGREMYIYFPNGMARPSFSWSVLERVLKMTFTSRNWNTVNKLLELAESLSTAD